MLKGQAKKDYQREYMREYMRNLRSRGRLLRPDVKTQLDPILDPCNSGSTWLVDADGNPVYIDN